jgi:4-hydroxybenzoate polyprenyltransferase
LTQSQSALREESVPENPPLFVDLDGTVVRSDTLLECVLAAAAQPLRLADALLSLRHGKARAKQELALVANLDPAMLPYNEPLLKYLRHERSGGRSVVLATGADFRIATAVAGHLALFDAVLASDGHVNLKGAAKLAAIRRMIGDRAFAYVGNHCEDLAIWQEAKSGIVVNAPSSVARAAAAVTAIERVLPIKTPWPKALLDTIRPHQWAKNLLVFVPMLTSRAVGDLASWGTAMMTFVAFCCAASGVYLVNDLCDLAADRRHPSKCRRPFASGTLPLEMGLVAAPLLLIAGCGLGMATGTLAIVLLYAVASIAYSVYFKSWPLVDVFTLTGLYTIRLFGGGEATGHLVSFWLLAFSSFLFLGLAIVKRVAELKALAAREGGFSARRGYHADDIGILQLMGVASSFVASMVLALYVQTELNPGLDRYPSASWAIVPLTLFWQCRIWLSTARGYMHDDPIVYAARDWVSWLVGICSFAVVLIGNHVSR